MKLSICIPTYNRAKHLSNCLNSIVKCKAITNLEFQVCVSDNCSTDQTEKVVRNAQSKIDIKYHKNIGNLGQTRNFLKVVSMADGDFIWLIGDDDLLMPYAINAIYKLIDDHPTVDFFYVNSYHLDAQFLENYPAPFDVENLPNNMIPFSKWEQSGEMKFFELIDPKISFDFLGGMFLSVFRKENWVKSAGVLDKVAVEDTRTFSYFDNTFPHVKIFANAFANSKAYFNVRPLNVCLTGVREWAHMYPFIQSVRLIEALDQYRSNGLPYLRYLRCKNYALNNFIPDFVNIVLHKDKSGYVYISPLKILVGSFLYPNFYLSFFYFAIRKFRRLIGFSK